jgi:WD40 repeat protein
VREKDSSSPSSQCVQVFDMTEGVVAGTFRGKGFGRIRMAPVFSPDAKTVLVCGYDRKRRGAVAIWDFRNHQESMVFCDRTSGREALASASFLPDGKTIRVVSGFRSVRYVSVDTGNEVPVPFPEDAIRFSQSRDGRYLALATKNGDIQLYASPSHETVWRREGWRTNGPSCLDVSPDGDTLAIGVRNRVVVWCVSRNAPVGVLDHSGPNQVVAADFSPDGKRIVTGTERDCQWDPKTGKRIETYGKATVWSVASKKLEWVPRVKATSVKSVRFHPNGRFILTGGETAEAGGEVALWDIEGKRLARNQFERRVSHFMGRGLRKAAQQDLSSRRRPSVAGSLT